MSNTTIFFEKTLRTWAWRVWASQSDVLSSFEFPGHRETHSLRKPNDESTSLWAGRCELYLYKLMVARPKCESEATWNHNFRQRVSAPRRFAPLRWAESGAEKSKSCNLSRCFSNQPLTTCNLSRCFDGRPSKVMYCRHVKHGFTAIYYTLGMSNSTFFLSNMRIDNEYTKAKEEAGQHISKIDDF